MEEEKMLKQKYNDLLESLYKGTEYLKQKPDDEKAQKRLDEIAIEMQNIMQAIPNMTDEEREKGFIIEESNEQIVEPVKKKITKSNNSQVKNIQVKPGENNPNIISTTTGNIELTPEIVRQYLVNGQGDITDQEVAMFIGMCKANRLNPFNKDAYLIKYGSQPASIITSKDVFFKRAIENPNFNGMESGLIILGGNNELIKREGSIYAKGEEILGAWCRVYRKDWEHPVYQEVNMSEYAGKTKTGELNSNWKTKPAVMITKVAEATALRKAFTDNLQGMYLLEESDDIEEKREPPVNLS